MSKRLYIGNLSYSTTEETLRSTFSAESVSIPSGPDGRPKGFAFVDIADDNAAAGLIEQWNGKELDGRNIVVNEARPREERSQGGYQRDNRSGGNYR